MTRISAFVTTVSAALVVSSLASAQSLITDLFTSPSGGSSAGIDEIVVAGNQAFFAAQGSWGEELYVTDGTNAGTQLTKDLGVNLSSQPSDIVALGNEVLFAAIVDGLGRELWKSDGTAAGTVLVKDVSAGPSFGNPRDLVRIGNLVYFAAYDGSGSGLWVSDGTTAGTTPVFTGGQAPQNLTVVGATLYFSLSTFPDGTELWKSDGTAAGTSQVIDLEPVGSSSPTNMRAFQGGLLFSGSTTAAGYEPYFTDGTAAGTVQLADLHPTSNSYPEQFAVVGSRAVFLASDGVNSGKQLYVTDGTPAGTSLLMVGISATQLTTFGPHVYFSATDVANGRELWRTDGTVAGTSLFVDIAATTGSTPEEFAVIGNELWFSAEDPINGREPWQTDGTVAGTHLVRNIAPAAFSSSPRAMIGLGADVLCAMADSGVGNELGRIAADGSSAVIVKDIDTPLANSTPGKFVAFPGGAFFTAVGDGIGREAFVTDGTAAGTVTLDVWPVANAGSNPSDPVAIGSEVFFSAGIGIDRELWKTDGTPAGTMQLSDLGNIGSTSPSRPGAAGNRLVFAGFQPGSGFELWSSDGTPGGTGMLLEITPGAGNSTIENMTSNGSVVVFLSYQPAIGSELFVSDGTVAGTFAIDLTPGAAGTSPQHIVNAGGTFFFSGGTVSSRTLWSSDGSAAGTVSVAPSTQLSGVFALTPSGTRVFGRGSMPGMGQELFVSDGTAAGTIGIDLVAGSQSSVFSSLTGGAGGAFFVYSGAGNGNELWFSDGTQAGTGEVLDIAPGPANGVVVDSIVPILGGAQVAFFANDLSNGLQLWTSDGTAAGTVMATSFQGNGVGAADLGEIYSNGADVFFAADDGVLGIEPWSLNTGAPFVLDYGSGCAGTGQPVPKISASGGGPAIGNAAFAVDVSNAQPVTFAPLFIGFAPSNINLGSGCSALVQFPILTFGPAVTSAAGSGSVAVPLPNDPAAIGVSLFFQYGVVAATGPFLGFLDLSDGLHVQVGN